MRRLVLRFVIAAFVLLTLSRLGLSLWQFQRVHDAGGLWPVMFGGLRIDVSFLAMIVGIPAVLSPWLGHRPWPTRIT